VDAPEPWRTLAERLREAHRRVARADVDVHVRRDLTRRLLALTDAAKHDAVSASRRLDRFLRRLDGATAGADDSATSGTHRSAETGTHDGRDGPEDVSPYGFPRS
jgi:hypothetical protein